MSLVWVRDGRCERGSLPNGTPLFWLMPPTRRVRDWRLHDHTGGAKPREERFPCELDAKRRAEELMGGHLRMIGAVAA